MIKVNDMWTKQDQLENDVMELEAWGYPWRARLANVRLFIYKVFRI